MTRINKREARKLFAEGKPFYLCPCKLHPASPWNVAALVHPADYKSWEQLYDNWAFYNTSYETGYYAHYYTRATK
jgi:hypothetical protein